MGGRPTRWRRSPRRCSTWRGAEPSDGEKRGCRARERLCALPARAHVNAARAAPSSTISLPTAIASTTRRWSTVQRFGQALEDPHVSPSLSGSDAWPSEAGLCAVPGLAPDMPPRPIAPGAFTGADSVREVNRPRGETSPYLWRTRQPGRLVPWRGGARRGAPRKADLLRSLRGLPLVPRLEHESFEDDDPRRPGTSDSSRQGGPL